MKDKKKESVAIDIKSLTIPLAIVLAGVFIGAGLFFGIKGKENPVIKEAKLEENTKEDNKPSTVLTSINDDPILGNKNSAKVAIVEFSDYECPFCKRFVDQTLGEIKENYINAGKAILVYRDLPLSFHNPAAEQEAMAAECAREQGDDKTYFKFHDKIFETSPGSGKGISLEQMAVLAKEIGIDGEKLKTCVEENKYRDEVAQDASDADKAAIRGTPGFIVGKLAKDGSVEGTLISGAQPFSVFQNAIDQLL